MLLSRLQVQSIAVGPPTPDRFTYTAAVRRSGS